MVALESSMNGYSKALAVKTDMNGIAPLVRHNAKDNKFPFLAYVAWLDTDIQKIENELAFVNNHGDLQEIYTRKRGQLRSLKSDLETLRATILGSQAYEKDKENKEAWEKFERDEAIKKEANRIAAQKAVAEQWAREEKLRIERERLQFEREKAQREREKYARDQQQN